MLFMWHMRRQKREKMRKLYIRKNDTFNVLLLRCWRQRERERKDKTKQNKTNEIESMCCVVFAGCHDVDCVPLVTVIRIDAGE